MVPAVLGFGLGLFAEAVLGSARDVLQVPHSPSSVGPSSLSLLTPVIPPHLLIWVAACGAGFLLDVETPLAATDAQRVRFSGCCECCDGGGGYQEGIGWPDCGAYAG